MSAPPNLSLERTTQVTLFGLGLWDPVANRLTSDRLSVRLFAVAGGRLLPPVSAPPNRRGVFVARSLAGMRAVEQGAGDDAFWSALPPSRPYLVEVRDGSGTFLSFVMPVDLPGPRGFVLPQCIADLELPEGVTGSPPVASPPAPTYVPLFSTPARAVPAGMAAVRASMIDGETGRPAAFVVLELHHAEDGRLVARAIADERGEVAAIFPYPEVATQSAPASPPAPPLPLAAQSWQLDVVVRYGRDVARHATDAFSPPLPDLCDVVRQPIATIATASPPTPLTQAMLAYGAELVLAADSGRRLLITPT